MCPDSHREPFSVIFKGMLSDSASPESVIIGKFLLPTFHLTANAKDLSVPQPSFPPMRHSLSAAPSNPIHPP